MTDLRYPIGRFEHDCPVTDADLALWIGQIELLPGQMRSALNGLTEEQLGTVSAALLASSGSHRDLEIFFQGHGIIELFFPGCE